MTRHVVVHDGSRHGFGFECLHCKALLGIALPISIDEYVAASNAFVARHRDCQPASAAVDSAPRTCAKCGRAENAHNVRHPFVATGGAS